MGTTTTTTTTTTTMTTRCDPLQKMTAVRHTPRRVYCAEKDHRSRPVRGLTLVVVVVILRELSFSWAALLQEKKKERERERGRETWREKPWEKLGEEGERAKPKKPFKHH